MGLSVSDALLDGVNEPVRVKDGVFSVFVMVVPLFDRVSVSETLGLLDLVSSFDIEPVLDFVADTSLLSESEWVCVKEKDGESDREALSSRVSELELLSERDFSSVKEFVTDGEGLREGVCEYVRERESLSENVGV